MKTASHNLKSSQNIENINKTRRCLKCRVKENKDCAICAAYSLANNNAEKARRLFIKNAKSLTVHENSVSATDFVFNFDEIA